MKIAAHKKVNNEELEDASGGSQRGKNNKYAFAIYVDGKRKENH